jgi:UDP-N-acetylmuramoylalanine--D-glutamate ligase
VVYDEKAGVGRSFAEFAQGGHRLAVFSPGFAVDHPWLCTAARHGCECLAELDFASLFWRGGVVAITGTNGKTTLTEFLTHALQSIGRKAQATGNIGYSFSRLVLELNGGEAAFTAVCEVSSFQSEVLWHFRADAVLWTNFAEDHLERHPGLGSYFSAKYQLFALAPESRLFAGASVAEHAARLGYVLPEQACVRSERLDPDPRLKGTVFEGYPQRENFEMAKAWWERSGLDIGALYAAAGSFRLGRHRLRRVAEVGGVEWWNDSKATNFHAVEAALGGFEKPVLLIAGGKAKGGDIVSFVGRIAPQVRHVFVIGETRELLARACKANRLAHTECGSLEEAVARAAGEARPGEQVLLSPAFASFDMFRSYEHRGEVFETEVRRLQARENFPEELTKQPSTH